MTYWLGYYLKQILSLTLASVNKLLSINELLAACLDGLIHDVV